MEGIVSGCEVLAGVVVVAEEAPGEIGFVAIGERESRAKRGRRLGTDGEVFPFVSPFLTRIVGVHQVVDCHHGIAIGHFLARTVVESHRVTDVFNVALCVAVDVKLLRDGTTDERLRTQGEVSAEWQVEIHAQARRKLCDVVALHDTIAVGDGSVVIPDTLRFPLIAHLVQVSESVLELLIVGGSGQHIVAGIGRLIEVLQAQPGINSLDGYIIGKVAEVLVRPRTY